MHTHEVLASVRAKLFIQRLLEKAKNAVERDEVFRCSRGIFPQPATAIATPNQSTFEWILRPPDGICSGRCYTDGSRIGRIEQRFGSCAWAPAVVDAGNQPIGISR